VAARTAVTGEADSEYGRNEGMPLRRPDDRLVCRQVGDDLEELGQEGCHALALQAGIATHHEIAIHLENLRQPQAIKRRSGFDRPCSKVESRKALMTAFGAHQLPYVKCGRYMDEVPRFGIEATHAMGCQK